MVISVVQMFPSPFWFPSEFIIAVPAMYFSGDATIEAVIKIFAESKTVGFGDFRLSLVFSHRQQRRTKHHRHFRMLGKKRVLARLQEFQAVV